MIHTHNNIFLILVSHVEIKPEAIILIKKRSIGKSIREYLITLLPKKTFNIKANMVSE